MQESGNKRLKSFFKNTCPDAGIIINGNILRGCSNFAGEVSHLPFGINPNWSKLEENPEELSSYIASILSTFSVIINPEVIILTGTVLNTDVVSKAKRRMEKYIPKEHQTQIHLIRNASSHYMKGLFAIALEVLED